MGILLVSYCIVSVQLFLKSNLSFNHSTKEISNIHFELICSMLSS